MTTEISIQLSRSKLEFSFPFQDFHHLHTFGLEPNLLNNLEQMMDRTASLIERLNLNVIGEPSPIEYPQQGIGAHYHLSESGLTFYTWPQERYASYLLHTCSKDFNTNNLVAAAADIFSDATKILIVRYNQPDTLNIHNLSSLPRLIQADARISYLTGHLG